VNLYEYRIWGQDLECRVLEDYEERLNSYIKKDAWPARVLKSKIGILSGNDTVVFLTERDETKAKSIFRHYYEQTLADVQKWYGIRSAELKGLLEKLN